MDEIVDSPLSFNPHEDISACYSALSSISDLDTYLMDKDEKEMISEIKKMSLYIIYAGIREIYTSNFYGEETDTQDSTS